jgi:hypothetical protein
MLGNSDTFYINNDGIIRFCKVVYLLAKLREEFVKQIHKSLIVGYIRIIKTQDYVVAKYYFLLIIRVVEQVIYDCDVY